MHPAPSHATYKYPLYVGFMLVTVTVISPDFEAVNSRVPGFPPGVTRAVKVSVWLFEGLAIPPQADAARATRTAAKDRRNRACIDVLSRAGRSGPGVFELRELAVLAAVFERELRRRDTKDLGLAQVRPRRREPRRLEQTQVLWRAVDRVVHLRQLDLRKRSCTTTAVQPVDCHLVTGVEGIEPAGGDRREDSPGSAFFARRESNERVALRGRRAVIEGETTRHIPQVQRPGRIGVEAEVQIGEVHILECP